MATVTLTWTDPTLRIDTPPTPLAPSEIAGVDVFDGGVLIGSATGPAVTFTTGVLSVGGHVFTVVVRDTTGHSSADSNGVSVVVPAVLANPAAVTDLAAALNP